MFNTPSENHVKNGALESSSAFVGARNQVTRSLACFAQKAIQSASASW